MPSADVHSYSLLAGVVDVASATATYCRCDSCVFSFLQQLLQRATRIGVYGTFELNSTLPFWCTLSSPRVRGLPLGSNRRHRMPSLEPAHRAENRHDPEGSITRPRCRKAEAKVRRDALARSQAVANVRV